LRLILNIIWFVLARLWMAIAYAIAALICFILIITIPFGGWWLALGHLITGIALCVTIIGIPLGLANFKLIPISLMPLGREIVPVVEAGAFGVR
jgi:uncharacterized membrane protein YccF (DUF307 family)